MLELTDREQIQKLGGPTNYQIDRLKTLAYDSFNKLTHHQTPEGYIAASIGRCDDPNFGSIDSSGVVRGNIWVKDAARALQHTLDPDVIKFLPELYDPEFARKQGFAATAPDFYIKGIRGLLRLQTQPEQQHRLNSVPYGDDGKGYRVLRDDDAAAIKFNPDGTVNPYWPHNQPDNWGSLLLTAGKGIEQGWPVLTIVDNTQLPPGLLLGKTLAYTTRSGVERLVCRSIWEHGEGHSSYSTRRIVHGGLQQMHKEPVWKELEHDEKQKGYTLPISRSELGEAIARIEEKIKEHFPADWTDNNGHESTGDLAQLVVLNDLQLPEDEQLEILAKTAELENRYGFHRYLGDHWKKGRAETKWVMGKPIMARYNFKKSMEAYQQNKPVAAFRALDHGWDQIMTVMEMIDCLGYVPELFEEKDGIYGPNNNELAWTRGYAIEACGAGIGAFRTSEEYYRQHR